MVDDEFPDFPARTLRHKMMSGKICFIKGLPTAAGRQAPARKPSREGCDSADDFGECNKKLVTMHPLVYTRWEVAVLRFSSNSDE
jgi:hypothetical protein